MMPDNDPRLVRDLMTVGVATCPPDTPVAGIARLLLEKDLEAVIVLDPGEGHDLGIHASRQAPLEAFFQRRDETRRRNTPNK
jgi:CBS domain-containing protein